ncbi:MAG: chorismate-binding protein [archaeon]|nr:MAG: chorismate-binding protein [archaeon]
MPECPKCGAQNKKPVTQWTGGAKTKKPMAVQRFVCGKCGTSFVAWKDSKTGEVKTMTRK